MITLKQTQRENGSMTITMAQEKAVRSLQLFFLIAHDNDVGIGICGWLLTAFSWAIVIVTLPFSLFVCFKVNITAWTTDTQCTVLVLIDFRPV